MNKEHKGFQLYLVLSHSFLRWFYLQHRGGMSSDLIFASLMDVKWYLIIIINIIIICPSLTTSELEHFFIFIGHAGFLFCELLSIYLLIFY